MIDDSHLHAAIIGQTKSGKTYLGMRFARDFRAKGIGVIVLHKPREPWPMANWQTDDPEKFAEKFWKCWGCAVFIEVSDASVGKFDDRFHKMFEQGRHQGHRCFFLSQRGEKVHPNIRENCDGLYLFSSGFKGSRTWAEEMCDDSLLNAAMMPPRRFWYKQNRYTPARLLTLGK